MHYTIISQIFSMVSARSLEWTSLLVQLVASGVCLIASMAVISAKLQSTSIYPDKQFVRWVLGYFLSKMEGGGGAIGSGKVVGYSQFPTEKTRIQISQHTSAAGPTNFSSGPVAEKFESKLFPLEMEYRTLEHWKIPFRWNLSTNWNKKNSLKFIEFGVNL